MRPRLLPDVRFVRYAEGVYVHGDLGACTITGEHSYEWLSRLAPYLTGEHTLGELTESLSDERRELVEQLVGALAEQRFVADARDERPHALDDEERDVYAPEIAYIGYAHDSAEHRFERLRKARIAVAVTGTAGAGEEDEGTEGIGPVVAALIEAGLGSGWRDVRVTGVPAAGLSAAVEAGRRDAAQQVLACEEVPGDADVVLHVHQGEDSAALTRISEQRSQAAHGKTAHGKTAHGQVWVRGDEAWLTPVSDAAAAPYWRRLAGWPPTQEEPGTCLLTGPVPMVVAAQAALSCFEYLTGLAGNPADESTGDTSTSGKSATNKSAENITEDHAADLVMTRVDLRTLDTSRHRPRPLRLRPTAAAVTVGAGLRRLARRLLGAGCWSADCRHADYWSARLLGTGGAAPAAASATAGDLLARAAGFIGQRTGVLGELDEGGLVQVPWRVCAATISDPLGVLPSWAPAPKVFGWGPDRETARVRALLAGLAGYQALLAAERPAVPYVAPTGVGPASRGRRRWRPGWRSIANGCSATMTGRASPSSPRLTTRAWSSSWTCSARPTSRWSSATCRQRSAYPPTPSASPLPPARRRLRRRCAALWSGCCCAGRRGPRTSRSTPIRSRGGRTTSAATTRRWPSRP